VLVSKFVFKNIVRPTQLRERASGAWTDGCSPKRFTISATNRRRSQTVLYGGKVVTRPVALLGLCSSHNVYSIDGLSTQRFVTLFVACTTRSMSCQLCSVAPAGQLATDETEPGDRQRTAMEREGRGGINLSGMLTLTARDMQYMRGCVQIDDASGTWIGGDGQQWQREILNGDDPDLVCRLSIHLSRRSTAIRIADVTDHWLRRSLHILAADELNRRHRRRQRHGLLRSRSLDIVSSLVSDDVTESIEADGDLMGNANRRPDQRRRGHRSSSRSRTQLLDNEVPSPSSLIVGRRVDRPLYRSATIDGAFGDVAGAAGSFYEQSSRRASSGASTWSMMSDGISDMGSVQSFAVADLHSSFVDGGDTDRRRDGAITVYNVRSSAERFGLEQRSETRLSHHSSASMADYRQETVQQDVFGRGAVTKKNETECDFIDETVPERDQNQIYSFAVAALPAAPERTSSDAERGDEENAASDGEDLGIGRAGKKSIRTKRGRGEFDLVDFSNDDDDDDDYEDDDVIDTTDESDSAECTEPTVEHIVFTVTSEEVVVQHNVDETEKCDDDDDDDDDDLADNRDVTTNVEDCLVTINDDLEVSQSVATREPESVELSSDVSGTNSCDDDDNEVSDNDECNSTDVLLTFEGEDELKDAINAEPINNTMKADVDQRTTLDDELIVAAETERRSTRQQVVVMHEKEEQLQRATENMETAKRSSLVRGDDSFDGEEIHDVDENRDTQIGLEVQSSSSNVSLMLKGDDEDEQKLTSMKTSVFIGVDDNGHNKTHPYKELETLDVYTQVSERRNSEKEIGLMRSKSDQLANDDREIDEIPSESDDNDCPSPAEYSLSRVAYVTAYECSRTHWSRDESQRTENVGTVAPELSMCADSDKLCVRRSPSHEVVNRTVTSTADKPGLHPVSMEKIENVLRGGNCIEAVECLDGFEALCQSDNQDEYSTDESKASHGYITRSGSIGNRISGLDESEEQIQMNSSVDGDEQKFIGKVRRVDEAETDIDITTYSENIELHLELGKECHFRDPIGVTFKVNISDMTMSRSLDSTISALSSSPSVSSIAGEESHDGAVPGSDDGDIVEDGISGTGQRVGENQTDSVDVTISVDSDAVGAMELIDNRKDTLCLQSRVEAIDWLCQELPAEHYNMSEHLWECDQMNGDQTDLADGLDQDDTKDIPDDTGSDIGLIEHISNRLVSNVISNASHLVRQWPPDAVELSAPFDRTMTSRSRSFDNTAEDHLSATSSIATRTIPDSKIEKALLIVEINVVDKAVEGLHTDAVNDVCMTDDDGEIGSRSDASKQPILAHANDTDNDTVCNAPSHQMIYEERSERIDAIIDDFDGRSEDVGLPGDNIELTIGDENQGRNSPTNVHGRVIIDVGEEVAAAHDAQFKYFSKEMELATPKESEMHGTPRDRPIASGTDRNSTIEDTPTARHCCEYITQLAEVLTMETNVVTSFVSTTKPVVITSTPTDWQNEIGIVNEAEVSIVDDILEMSRDSISMKLTGSANADGDSDIDTDDIVNGWTLDDTEDLVMRSVGVELNDTQELIDACESSTADDDRFIAELTQPIVFIPAFILLPHAINRTSNEEEHASVARINAEDTVAEARIVAPCEVGERTELDAANATHRSSNWNPTSGTFNGEARTTASSNFVFNSRCCPEPVSVSTDNVCGTAPHGLHWSVMNIVDNGDEDIAVDEAEVTSLILASTVDEPEANNTRPADISVIDDVLEVDLHISTVVSHIDHDDEVRQDPTKTIDDEVCIVETAVRHIDIAETGKSRVSPPGQRQCVTVKRSELSASVMANDSEVLISSKAAVQSSVNSSKGSSRCSVNCSPTVMLGLHKPDVHVHTSNHRSMACQTEDDWKNVIDGRVAERTDTDAALYSSSLGQSLKAAESMHARDRPDVVEDESTSWNHLDDSDVNSTTTSASLSRKQHGGRGEATAVERWKVFRPPKTSLNCSERRSVPSVAAHGTESRPRLYDGWSNSSHSRPESLPITSKGNVFSRRVEALLEMDGSSSWRALKNGSAYVNDVKRIDNNEGGTMKLQVGILRRTYWRYLLLPIICIGNSSTEQG